MSAGHLRPFLLGVAGLTALTAADGVDHLRQSDPLPQRLAGTWTRLDDGLRLTVAAGDDLRDLAVGAYARDQERLTLRDGDDAGAWARALVGAPARDSGTAAERAAAAESLTALDIFSLVILTWRQADGTAYPWVGHGLAGGGLLGLCTPVLDQDIDGAGGTFQTASGLVPFGPGGAEIGDLIVARPAHAILVSDRGRPGILDPADEVVLALPAADPRVRRLPLAEVVGTGTFRIWRRDPTRIRAEDGPHQRAHHLQERADELAKLPPHRQWLAALGMLLVCASLLRWWAKRRRR